MPNQKKRQRRTGRQDEEQAMSKRLPSSAEAVEVVQLASDRGTPTDPKTDPITSKKTQVTPSFTEFIDFDKVMTKSELIPQAGPSNT